MSATLEAAAENKMVLKRLYQWDKADLWPKGNMSTDISGHFGVCLTQVTAIHSHPHYFLADAYLGPFSYISGVFLSHFGALENWQHREHRGDLKKEGGEQLSKPGEKDTETTLDRNTEVSVKR